MKSYKGPYSSLADAAHVKREESRRDEVLAQLLNLIIQAITLAKPLYLESHPLHSHQYRQMGKVFAHLIDAGDLLVAIQEKKTTP